MQTVVQGFWELLWTNIKWGLWWSLGNKSSRRLSNISDFPVFYLLGAFLWVRSPGLLVPSSQQLDWFCRPWIAIDECSVGFPMIGMDFYLCTGSSLFQGENVSLWLTKGKLLLNFRASLACEVVFPGLWGWLYRIFYFCVSVNTECRS